jgi:hypothetical protein
MTTKNKINKIVREEVEKHTEFLRLLLNEDLERQIINFREQAYKKFLVDYKGMKLKITERRLTKNGN